MMEAMMKFLPTTATSGAATTTTTTIAVLLLLLINISKTTVMAEKDSDYYFPGFVNPNTKREMYWKDSINIMQDLDQFESLYVTYHHCVWSKYGGRYGYGENYDEQGDNQEDYVDDDDGNNNAGNSAIYGGCGAWGGETYWYMGRTQCFKANAAYSLYGILKGSSSSSAKNDDGNKNCNKGTYINSFFTTFGVESFTGPLGLDTSIANSRCTTTQSGYGTIDDDAVKADDDYLGNDDFVLYDYTSFTSMGTGCSTDGDFTIDTYEGAFCGGRNYIQTEDALSEFNNYIREMDCTQIYGSSSSGNNNNRRDDRKLSEDNGNYYFNYDYANMNPINILKFSKSCSLRQYPNDCPDPYGLKKKYSRSINRGYQSITGPSKDFWGKFVTVLSCSNILIGLIVLGYSMVLYFANKNGRSVGGNNKPLYKNDRITHEGPIKEELQNKEIL